MLKWKGWMCVLGAVVFAATAFADAKDDLDAKIMGNYEGKFITPKHKAYALSAQVIAQGEGAFVGTLVVTYTGAGKGKIGTQTYAITATRGEGKTSVSGKQQSSDHFKSHKLIGKTLSGSIADGAFEGVLGENGATFKLSRVEKKSPTLGMAPPQGAVVLFDGSNLDGWVRWPEKWNISKEGAMEVAGSQLRTKQEFGDCKIHVEFRTPFMPKDRGQGRGNSGVYVAGRYEIQVLDSFGLPPADNECGGIYGKSVSKVNASLPPMEWQTYDIAFKAPRFDAAGNKTQNAVISVEHNGVLIHDKVNLAKETPGGMAGEAATGPLLLQDHSNRVQYRNIWVLPQ